MIGCGSDGAGSDEGAAGGGASGGAVGSAGDPFGNAGGRRDAGTPAAGTGATAGTGGAGAGVDAGVDAGSAAPTARCDADQAYCNGVCFDTPESAGGCAVAARLPGRADQLVVQDGALYWVDGEVAIRRHDLATASETTLAEDIRFPRIALIDGAQLYFTARADEVAGVSSQDRTVRKVATGGGGVTLLAGDLPGTSYVTKIGADLYLLDADEISIGPIKRLPMEMGPPVAVGPAAEVDGFAYDGTFLYYVSPLEPEPGSLIERSRIAKTPVSDPTLDMPIAEQDPIDRAQSLVLHEGYLYWPGPNARFLRLAVTGGEVEELAMPPGVVRGENVYYDTQLADGTTELSAMPLAGGAARSLGVFETAHYETHHVADDGVYVAITTAPGSTIFRLAL